MHKLLISFALTASLSLGGCSWFSQGDVVTQTLDTLPLIYRPEIQQGNLVTPEMLAELKVGLDKRQVRYLLGTPMLNDVFHADRWDYVYTLGIGSHPSEIRRMSLRFEDERLVQIDTDMKVDPNAVKAEATKEIVVSVPDYEGDDTLFGRIRRTVGLGED